MSDDPQDQAESLDEDVVDSVDDRTGDDFGDVFSSYPPDRPLGSDGVGGESLAERTAPEDSDLSARLGIADELDAVGQLTDEGAAMEDSDRVIADAEPGVDPSPEAAALHIERDTEEL